MREREREREKAAGSTQVLVFLKIGIWVVIQNGGKNEENWKQKREKVIRTN